ncbi:MAG: Nucleoside triphosphate pyrophosphohydrolase MazG [Myxococcaceae bacterium]|nr:Nucleoside triphosphate pyrophosphohydrolase MazG [Myxococcaceae bacterium]
MTQTGVKLPELMGIMRRLLAPDGCPWDREQTLATLRPFVIEEAHEVVDAIDKNDLPNLREELGDLLLQIVFQSALVEDKLGGAFGIDDVISGICDKMTRRHPHVFGDETAADSKAVLERWEQLKAKEKAGRGVLDGVPRSMPALLRALRVGEKAAQVGLDWPDARGPREKLDEELRELDEAISAGDSAAIEGELGDVLFSLVSVARKHGVDPEAALRGTLDRFSARTAHVEQTLRKEQLDARTQTPEQLDRLWKNAKEALNRAGK